MEELIVRYLHFVGILLLAAALVGEHLLLASEIGARQFRKIMVLDAVYGGSAGLVLVTGLLLWFAVGRPAEFYTQNGVFHAKVTLFFVIGFLSIYPTVFFIKNRKNQQQIIRLPKRIISVIRIEMALLILIPLLAVLMARGYGLV